MSDFDDFERIYDKKTKELDSLLSQLQDCDLSDWDSDFVFDMVKRLAKYGNKVVVSEKQQEQLDRMATQYDLDAGNYKGPCTYQTYKTKIRRES